MTHRRLIGSVDDAVMIDSTPQRSESRLEVVWALVLLQGAALALTTIESLVVNIGFGFLLLGNLVLTAAAATATLLAARGIRRRRRWARRLTIVGEWYVLAVGALDLALTVILAQTAPGLIPLVVTIGVPITVLLLLRGRKGDFGPVAESPVTGELPVPVEASVRPPADDPVLGTLLG